MNVKLLITISITLFFFSTSSVIARAALIDNAIDPFSFTSLRLFFGALVLLILLYIKDKKISLDMKSNWTSSLMLFLYAICFSYAYINLDAGLGALILFAVVQLTIICFALFKKESLTITKILGIALAILGLIYLLFPSSDFELSLYHVSLMVVSGLAWGVYTLLGKNCTNATLHTADNFTKALLFIGIFYFFINETYLSSYGVFLAFLTGGITSALGYALWYTILPKLETMTSGVVQLLVPPLAIFLSVLLLNEELSTKLILSTIVILVGIYIYLTAKQPKA